MEDTKVIEGKIYTQVKDKFFLHGMYCVSDIYGVTNGIPVLLCSQSVISDKFFAKIHHMHNLGMEIYVEQNAFEKMEVQFKHLSNARGGQIQKLRAIRSQFGDMLTQIAKEQRINMDMMVPILSSLELTVREMDLTFMIFWTSYMRDMDKYLQTHCSNVSIINGKIAEWLGMDEEHVKKAIIIGLLHDLGKMQIPDSILNKPGKLTEEEFDVVKNHPVYSYEICKKSGIVDEEVLEGVRGHHEKMNGMGYPDGLHIDNIPLYAKITEISDVYDAMVAQRVYKDSSTPFRVLNEFVNIRYGDLDIKLVDTFLKKMKSELIGKNVILNDGRVAEICYMDDNDFLHPMVRVGGEVVKLDDHLQCVTLCTKTGVI